jgi:hypothetical protein
MNFLINRFCQSCNAHYYPCEEGRIQRCAHIQRDNENLNCTDQFPCFECRNVLQECGQDGVCV